MEITQLLILMFSFWSCQSELIINRTPKIYRLYKNRLQKMTVMIRSANPFNTLTLEKRQQMCDEVLQAKEFEPLTHLVKAVSRLETETEYHFPILENCQRSETDSINLQCKSQKVYANKQRLTMKIFPCMITADKIWYVTYGLKEGQMFLLETFIHNRLPREDEPIRIIGLIEAPAYFNRQEWTPSNLSALNEQLTEQIGLARNETKRRVQIVTSIPERMRLSFLNDVQYLRLCSSIFAAMSTLTNGYFQEYVRKVNYVQFRMKRKKRFSRLAWSYIVNAQFIACVVNGDVKVSQFYALASLSERGAAFIFRTNTKHRYSRTIHLEGKVSNIQVLLEIQEELGETSRYPPDTDDSEDE